MIEGETELLRSTGDLPPGRVDALQERSFHEEVRSDKPRILIVDDQRMIADSLADIFESEGFEPTAAYEGKEALEVAKKIRPEYLLTDVVMPAMNGVELAIAVKKSLPATKILLLSGQAGISNILSGGRDQGYEFELIAKPVHPEKLIERVKNLPD